MKKKALIIVAIIVVIALFAGLIFPIVSKDKSADDAENGSGTVSVEDTDAKDQKEAESKPENDTSADESKKEKESESVKDSASSDSEEEIEGGSGSPAGSGDSGASSDGAQTETQAGDAQPGSDKQDSKSQASDEGSGGGGSTIPVISFPYEIPGTDLVVQQIRSYDGIYIEDGSDSETAGIAALVLTNNGENLEFAGIGISQGTRNLGFSASQIPAGATIIIQEQTKASYSTDPYYTATATTTPVDEFEMSEDLVSVKDNGDNSLTVKNNSDETLGDVKVFFKNYLPDEDVYVGGITYNITLTDLEAGSSLTVSASHYDSTYSKVVKVEAE